MLTQMKDGTMEKERKMGKRRSRKSGDEERSLINVATVREAFRISRAFFSLDCGARFKEREGAKKYGGGPTRTETIA